MLQTHEICAGSVVASLIFTLRLAMEILQTSSSLLTCSLACALPSYFPLESVFSSTGFKPCHFTPSKQFSTLTTAVQSTAQTGRVELYAASSNWIQIQLIPQFKPLTPHRSTQTVEQNVELTEKNPVSYKPAFSIRFSMRLMHTCPCKPAHSVNALRCSSANLSCLQGVPKGGAGLLSGLRIAAVPLNRARVGQARNLAYVFFSF